MIFESFEYKGEWWLPEDPSNKLSGTLKVTPERIILDLFGAFNSVFDNTRSDNYEIILGELYKGKDITLYQNQLKKLQENLPGDKRVSELSVRYVFVGEHFEKKDEINFSSMSFNFTHLENWLAHNPIKSKHIFEEDKGNELREYQMSFKPSKKIVLNIEQINSELTIADAWAGNTKINKFDFEFLSYLRLKPKEPKSFHWFNIRPYSLTSC